MSFLITNNLIWSDTIVPEDVEFIFQSPLKSFKLPWEWSEDGPILEFQKDYQQDDLTVDMCVLAELGIRGELIWINLFGKYLLVRVEIHSVVPKSYAIRWSTAIELTTEKIGILSL